MIDDKTLIIYTIFDRPKGFNCFVVYRDFVRGGKTTRDLTFTVVGPDIDQIRDFLSKQGLMKIPRHKDDHPSIIETWM